MTQHLETLQKYYDPATLRAWIADHEHSKNERQKAQVARWRRVLAELEKVEPSADLPQPSKTALQGGNFDGYTKKY